MNLSPYLILMSDFMLKEIQTSGRLFINKGLLTLSRRLSSNKGLPTLSRAIFISNQAPGLHILYSFNSWLISIPHESALQYLATNSSKLQLLNKQLDSCKVSVRKVPSLSWECLNKCNYNGMGIYIYPYKFLDIQ